MVWNDFTGLSQENKCRVVFLATPIFSTQSGKETLGITRRRGQKDRKRKDERKEGEEKNWKKKTEKKMGGKKSNHYDLNPCPDTGEHYH